MQFVYPFALFALLAIPILIIIYILRNKYKEETQPSTYLWEISERFLKKRNPLHSIEHLLALIIQILAITGLTLALAHPTFTLTGQADDIVFVLDASASMNMVRETTDAEGNTVKITRFEDAKTQILDKVENATDGCTFTLVLGDKEPRVVCSKITDVEKFEKYLDSVEVTDSYCDLDDAVAVAQKLFSDGKCNYCYIATDKKETSKAIADETATKSASSQTATDTSASSNDDVFGTEVIDVSTDQNNYAITSLEYSYAESNKKFIITGNAISYAEDALIDENGDGGLHIQISINGEPLAGVKHISCSAGTEEEFTVALSNGNNDYDAEKITEVSAQILETDCLDVDNSYFVYNNDVTAKTSILLVSDTPRFFELAFKYLPNITYKTVTTKKYTGQTGYDIYVFDCYTPEVLPTYGAVWLINSEDVTGSGYYYQTKRTLDEGGKLSYPEDDTSLLFKQLTKNVAKNEITIKSYKRYSVMGDFTTVLEYKTVPMIFAGKNDNGQREVVFAFDIHDSDLPMNYDFLALTRNFVTYCNPTVCSEYAYEVDDSIVLNLSDSTTKVTATTPSGKTELVDFNSQAVVSYQLEEVGTYEITVYSGEENYKTIKVYASFAKEEGDPAMAIKSYDLVGNDNTTKGNGLLDNILPVIIAGAVLFALDWILYTHEQF